MNPESYSIRSLLSRTPLPPPKGISHIDIGPFLWQGLPQATVAVQLDCRMRLAGHVWPPPCRMQHIVDMKALVNEVILPIPAMKRLWTFDGHSEARYVYRGAPPLRHTAGPCIITLRAAHCDPQKTVT